MITPIETVHDRLEELGLLRSVSKGGKQLLSLCPAHNDRNNPSLAVKEILVEQNGVQKMSVGIRCFAGCDNDAVLDALDLRWKDLYMPLSADNKKRVLAAAKQTRTRETKPMYDCNAIQHQYLAQMVPDSLGARYIQWRGISLETAQAYGIGYAPDGTWAHRKNGRLVRQWKFGRVTFPHTTPDGRIINFYGRAVGNGQEPKEVRHTHLPGAKGVFNAPALANDLVIICEGGFDALALIEAGYPQTAAIFGVSSFPFEWLQAKNVIFAMDHDQAGDTWRQFAYKLKFMGKRVFWLPASVYRGCKDLGETWQQHRVIDIDLSAISYTASFLVPEVPAPVVPSSLLSKPETASPIPQGYTVIDSTQVDTLLALKEYIIEKGVMAFDYESNSDPDDERQDPQDTQVVGVSVCCETGSAVYLPIAHQDYAGNWDRQWLFENFLKPLLLHPDVLILAHNVKVEHQWSILNGINFYSKAMDGKVMDTMLLVKGLALPETIDAAGKVRMGLKPATKALLADSDGMVHGLLHVDDIKSFKETVGVVEWEEPDPSGEVYKSGAKKGQPKTVKKKRTRRFDELPVDQHTIDYACSDADWTLGLFERLLPIAKDEGVYDLLVELDVPRMMLLGEYELSGWHVDPSGFHLLREEAESQLPVLDQKLMVELKALVGQEEVVVPAGTYVLGEHYGEPMVLEIKKDRPFSWKSVPHRQWLFFHILGISTEGLERSTKTGLPSVGAENFDKLVEGYEGDSPFMSLLKKKAKYEKILSTYVEGMGAFVRNGNKDNTNKLHTSFGLVDTWRLNSKKPNLQNIPQPAKDPLGIRGLFIAPDYDPKADYSHLNECTRPVNIITEEKLSGKTMWIGCDYSQLELRVIAVMAKEQGMIEAFHAGYDLHSATAKQVFNLECSVEEVKSKHKLRRKQAKAVNFGLVYGITEYGLAKNPDMQMTIDEAKKLMHDYFRTYPNIERFMSHQIAFAKRHGYVETLFGHRRPILGINDRDMWVQKRAINKAINTPVQGGGADIIARAMVNFRNIQEDITWVEKMDLLPLLGPLGLGDLDYLKRVVRSLKAVMQIHDELIFEVPVEYAAPAARLVKAIMELPVPGFSDVVPLVADPAVGKRWAHNLDIYWEDDGTPYVVAKKEKTEASDVTIDEIQYALPLYEKAGIEVRVK